MFFSRDYIRKFLFFQSKKIVYILAVRGSMIMGKALACADTRLLERSRVRFPVRSKNFRIFYCEFFDRRWEFLSGTSTRVVDRGRLFPGCTAVRTSQWCCACAERTVTTNRVAAAPTGEAFLIGNTCSWRRFSPEPYI